MGSAGDTDHARVHLSVYEDLDALAHAAADLLVQLQSADRPQEHFNLALSGGSTPRTFHNVLVAPPYLDQIDWESMQYLLGRRALCPTG